MNVCIIYKSYILIELTFLKVLILVRQMFQRSVLFATIGIFKLRCDACNRYHDVLMSINLNDIAILNIPGVDYRCIINGISKSEAVNVL